MLVMIYPLKIMLFLVQNAYARMYVNKHNIVPLYNSCGYAEIRVEIITLSLI